MVPSLRVDLQNEIREIAVAGALRKVLSRREAGGSHAGDLAITRAHIDPQRHKEVADRLAIQVRDATVWRDQILKYFQGFSGLPIVPPKEG